MSPAGVPAGIAAADLKRVVKDILRHKNNASENAGLAGQAVGNAVEQYALDRKALMLVVGLAKKEPAQAQGTIRAMMDYADKYGLLDQLDAFDDLIPTLERIVERAKNVRPSHGAPSGKADVLGSLLGGKQPETVQ
ncbi:hypothetical protein [Devosia ginsengisoli]|uniref:hypothetical protein n=1 Tax=Devosia ginsengisoli TaxID=400770 RepID=UPI0026EBC818|nr:hypothetical protein [Devosia ginsengisoli]MCR6673281.1 hypothetical protein [Devosia ginsengisoli]